jgi:hypothetical protein
MFISNTLLIFELFVNEKKRINMVAIDDKRTKAKHIGISVLSLTTLFIVISAPAAICNYFINSLVTLQYGEIILFIADCIQFTFNGFSLVALLITNKHFLRVFKNKMSFLRFKNNVIDVMPQNTELNSSKR